MILGQKSFLTKWQLHSKIVLTGLHLSLEQNRQLDAPRTKNVGGLTTTKKRRCCNVFSRSVFGFPASHNFIHMQIANLLCQKINLFTKICEEDLLSAASLEILSAEPATSNQYTRKGRQITTSRQYTSISI